MSECEHCSAEFTLDDGCEDDALCHSCAHEIAETAVNLHSQLIRSDCQLATTTRELEALRKATTRWDGFTLEQLERTLENERNSLADTKSELEAAKAQVAELTRERAEAVRATCERCRESIRQLSTAVDALEWYSNTRPDGYGDKARKALAAIKGSNRE